MKAMRRAGGFADCPVRLSRKSKCLCPSRNLQKSSFPWHRQTWEKKLWKQTRSQGEWLSSNVIRKHSGECPKRRLCRSHFAVPTEFPQIRTERVGETRRNLETDACSGHSQTSGDKPTVSGDLTSIRRSQRWHSPRLRRVSQRSMTSGN